MSTFLRQPFMTGWSMKWIKDSKASIVVTSHRTDFARIFDRIVLMDGGSIASSDLNLDNSRKELEKAGVLLLWR